MGDEAPWQDDFVKEDDWEDGLDMIEEMYAKHKQAKEARDSSRPPTASRKRPESASRSRPTSATRFADNSSTADSDNEKDPLYSKFESLILTTDEEAELDVQRQQYKVSRAAAKRSQRRDDLSDSNAIPESIETMLGKLAQELDDTTFAPKRVTKRRPISAGGRSLGESGEDLKFDKKTFQQRYLSPYHRRKERPTSAQTTKTSASRPSTATSRKSRPSSAMSRGTFTSSMTQATAAEVAKEEQDKEKRKAASRVKKVMQAEKSKQQKMARKLRQEFKDFEETCVVKIREANDFCRILNMDKSFRIYQPKMANVGSPMRIDVFVRNEKVRDISLELFLREHRKLEEKVFAKHGVKVERGSNLAYLEQHKGDPHAQKCQVREDLRVVLLETIQLTTKLRDQLEELEMKGKGPYSFSPYS